MYLNINFSLLDLALQENIINGFEATFIKEKQGLYVKLLSDKQLLVFEDVFPRLIEGTISVTEEEPQTHASYAPNHEYKYSYQYDANSDPDHDPE